MHYNDIVKTMNKTTKIAMSYSYLHSSDMTSSGCSVCISCYKKRYTM